MKTEKIYDIIGIGIGPFNLGLAALADSVEGLECAFFDKSAGFDWHPGLMLDNARMQVPFYADLVTLADPCSKYSYLAFLKAKERLFRFGIHENNYPTRKEYNAYCKWVAGQLKNLHFSMCCQAIHFHHQRQCYEVYLTNKDTCNTYLFRSRHIVVGTGTIPNMPTFVDGIENKMIFHSGEYLFKKKLLKGKRVSVVGSGQSAAEIFNDLLQYRDELESVQWYTRSKRFYPMEYSRLSLEMTSPDYVDYFFSLPAEKKKEVVAKQDMLFKGINYSLINEIYDQLYNMHLDGDVKELIGLFTNIDLRNIDLENGVVNLSFKHVETQKCFERETDVVVLATGYKNVQASFLEPLGSLIERNVLGEHVVKRNYSIDYKNTLFVQNAELHSHGFNSADLGMGPYRNSIILNEVLGREVFKVEKEVAFQSFF